MKTRSKVPSVAEFAENVEEFLAEMREKESPMVLSVDDKPAVVVLDLRFYQYLAETDDRHFKELLKARVGEIDRGEDESIPWEDVRRDLMKKFGSKGKSKS